MRRASPASFAATAKTFAPCAIRRWVMAVPRSPVAPVTMIFLPEKSMKFSFQGNERERASGAGWGFFGDHRELTQVDVTGDEVGRSLQEGPQVLALHVDRESFGGAPVLVDKPDIGVVERLMQVVVEAPCLGPRGLDQGRKGRAERLGLVRPGTQESDVRKLGHGFRPSEEVRSAAAATTLRAALKP